MNKTKWIIFAVAVVAVFGLVVWLGKSNNSSSTASSNFKGDPSKVINDGPIADHVIGNKDAKVVFVEYADYECPGCDEMAQPVEQLVAKYSAQVAFVFRNFPLTTIHPNALAAATAAEAAGLQGKYFGMHDLLYQNQTNWAQAGIDQRQSIFEGYANQLGLDMNKFKQDLSSQQISDKINRDRSTGLSTYKVDSTPSWVLNGTLISGNDAVDINALGQKLQDAVSKAYPAGSQSTAPAAAPVQ